MNEPDKAKNNGGSSKLSASLDDAKEALARYKVITFVLLVTAVYGYVLFQIYSLSSQADQPSVSSDASTVNLHIDKSVAERLKGLQDNSVNVQALFNDARNNPFSQ